MQSEYGAKKGESVFYASINKGKVKGAERGGKVRSGIRAGGVPGDADPVVSSYGGKVSSGDNSGGFHHKGAPAGNAHPMAHAKSMGKGRW